MTSRSLPSPRTLRAMQAAYMAENTEDDEPSSRQDEGESEQQVVIEEQLDNFSLLFDDADISGDCRNTLKEPEPQSVTLFPTDFPAQKTTKAGTRIEVSHRQMDDFIYVNAEHLVGLGYTITDAIKIGYFRLLAAGNGLTSPDFDHEVFYITENHSRRLSKVETARRIFSSQDLGIRNIIGNVLCEKVRYKAYTHFTDIVCCVAYMFRVRGHRYRPDILPRYEALWEKCSKRKSDLVLSWRHMAIESLYPMFPIILDWYWVNSAHTSVCNYALCERLDVPPAGIADIAALEQGMADIKLLLPGVFSNFAQRYETFYQQYAAICETRWRGSIHCRLYGKEPVQFDNDYLAPLAAAVVGVFDELAPEYPLLCSRTIHRLAERAAHIRDVVTMAIREAIACGIRIHARSASI